MAQYVAARNFFKQVRENLLPWISHQS